MITIHSSIEHRGHLCTVYLFARHVSNLEDVADLDGINSKLHSWDRCSRNLAGICDCFSTPKDEGMSQCFFFASILLRPRENGGRLFIAKKADKKVGSSSRPNELSAPLDL